MTRSVAKTTKTIQKRVSVPVYQQPETYNKLLAEYISLVRDKDVNPYEFSFKERFRENFSAREQVDFAKSPHINDFIKTPDTLAQELPAAKEMLKRLDQYDDQAIRTFAKLNSLNLSRLRRRSIQNQIGPSIAVIGSLTGLLFDLQDLLAISIKDAFARLSEFNFSLLIQIIIILIIIFAIAIARINWLFIMPRIGLVDAFGDILQIILSHCDLQE